MRKGLRVCDEGEHGTKWREDCKVCQCKRPAHLPCGQMSAQTRRAAPSATESPLSLHKTRPALVLFGVLLAACTSHAPADRSSGPGLIQQLRWGFDAATMSAEERQAAEDRAAVREMQRKQGLRVCEEGEHGTRWMEDCIECRCEHGRRRCPPIKCTHTAPVKKHPRAR